jgi:AcrR family transcriptional regulator
VSPNATAVQSDAATAPPAGCGRPLDQEISARILTATLDLLELGGFAKLSIERVAQRAGVHRPAIYRRWPNKVELVVAAVQSLSADVDDPGTGDVRTDLVEVLATAAEAGRRNRRARVRFQLLAEVADDEALSAVVTHRIVGPRRALVLHILERGQATGCVRAGADLGLVVDMLFGTLQSRLFVMRRPLGRAQVEALVDTVLDGISPA